MKTEGEKITLKSDLFDIRAVASRSCCQWLKLQDLIMSQTLIIYYFVFYSGSDSQ